MHEDKRIIVALDVQNQDEAETLLHAFGSIKPFVKVGMQLFYATGPRWVRQLKLHGYPVFLDLKLHDIPQTVYLAAQNLARLEVDMVTVHIAGGREMLQAAVAGIQSVQSVRTTKILGITQLTSTDKRILNEEIGIPGTVEDSVAHYAGLGKDAGLDGVVCSGWEAAHIKQQFGDAFLAVTPGIRLPHDEQGDQKRVMTPEAAIGRGADYLVIGRSITRADDPAIVYQTCVKSLVLDQSKDVSKGD